MARKSKTQEIPTIIFDKTAKQYAIVDSVDEGTSFAFYVDSKTGQHGAGQGSLFFDKTDTDIMHMSKELQVKAWNYIQGLFRKYQNDRIKEIN